MPTGRTENKGSWHITLVDRMKAQTERDTTFSTSRASRRGTIIQRHPSGQPGVLTAQSPIRFPL